ncbi:glycosyltransferase (plasmid) [Prescottella equi]|uniref:glycosyltransferase n=1 Tax=Rhodococcus hoagii TaxID=43767 RepID=UPI002574E85F|nr:glycosyltransferase [Prescottella equi]WJJ14447.1 glycosyltransferase [Prescottella equi]
MAVDLVSVIIPAFNAVELIDEQLEALAGQDYTGRFEVLVSDNGSTDGLASHLAAHRLASRLDLRRVDSSGRRGCAHARNVALEHSRGDFIAFCDADDRVHPGWLTALASAAAEFDAVGGGVETTSLNSPLVASWRIMPEPEERFGGTTFLPYAIGCNLAAWRYVFDKVGGFDEALVDGGEDVEMSWRIQFAGFTLGHSPDALVAYRCRPTLRGTWRQQRGYGLSSVQLDQIFAAAGKPTPGAKWYLTVVAAIVLLNPLVPQRISGMPRGRWVAQVGFLAGRLRGLARYRRGAPGRDAQGQRR